MKLPTIHTYPGLELAGYEPPPTRPARQAPPDDSPLGILDSLKAEAATYMKARFERDIAPKIREEAAKGAEAAVKPLVIGAMALSGVAVVLSILAIARGR